MYNKKQIYFFPILLVIYEMALYLANDMYIPALPTIAEFFSCSEQYAEWTVSAFILGPAFIYFFIGPFSARYGRRLTLLLSGLSFIAGSLGCIFSTSIEAMLVSRLISGSALAGMYVAGYSTIHELYEEREAIRILSLMISVAVLAPALGPCIGSMLLQWGDWRMTFWIVIAMASFAMLGFHWMMPESAQKDSIPTLSESIIHYKEIIKNSLFMANTYIYCATLAVFIGWVTVSPTLLINYFNLSELQFGFMIIPVVGSFSASSIMINKLMDKFELERIIYLGLAICSASLTGLVLIALLEKLSVLTLITSMAGFGFGGGLIMPPVNRLAMLSSEAPTDYKTTIFYFTGALIGALGSFLVSLISKGSPHVFAYTSLILFSSVSIVYALRKRILNDQIEASLKAVADQAVEQEAEMLDTAEV